MVQDVAPLTIHNTIKYAVAGELILGPNELDHDTIMVLPLVSIEVSTGNTYDITNKQGTFVPANQHLIVEIDTNKGAVRLVGTGDVYVSSVSLNSNNVFTDITNQIDPSFTGGGGGGATNLSSILTTTNITIASSSGTNAIIPLAGEGNAGLITPAEKTAIATFNGAGTTNLSSTPTPTNITIASSTGTDAVIPLADGTNAGLLSPAEKTAIANIGNGTTNLSSTPSPINVTIVSSTGTDAVIALADGTNAGLLSPAEKTAIANIGNGTTNLSSTPTPTNITIASSTGTDAVITLADETNAGLLSPTEKGDLQSLHTALQSGSLLTNLSTNLTATTATIVSSSGTDAVIPLADTNNAGLLSPAEKIAISNIGNGATNLSTNLTATTATIVSSSGTDAVIPLADTNNAGLLSPAEKTLISAGFPTNLSNTASPTAITVSSSTGTNTDLPLADATNAGLLSPADKVLIDGGFPTDLSNTASSTTITVSSSTGTNTDLPLADANNAGLLSPAEKTAIANFSGGASATVISGNTVQTISIPTDYTTIQAAINALDDTYLFTDNSYAKIVLEDGNYTISSPIEANTRQQDRILITAQTAPVDNQVEVNLTQSLGSISTSQTDTLSNNEVAYGSDNVVDGDLNTFNHTNTTNIGSYLEVNLGVDRQVTKVIIKNRDSFGTRLDGSFVELYDSNSIAVYTQPTQISGATDNSIHTITIPGNVVARSARLVRGTADFIHVKEFEVYGYNPGAISSDLTTATTKLDTDYSSIVTLDDTFLGDSWKSICITDLGFKKSGTYSNTKAMINLSSLQKGLVNTLNNGSTLENITVLNSNTNGISVSDSDYCSINNCTIGFNVSNDVFASNVNNLSASSCKFGHSQINSIQLVKTKANLTSVDMAASTSENLNINNCYSTNVTSCVFSNTDTTQYAVSTVKSDVTIDSCTFAAGANNSSTVFANKGSYLLDNGGNTNVIFNPAKGAGFGNQGSRVD